jgi:hypothetical protein
MRALREGGYTVYGKLVPVARSLTEGALPIGLASLPGSPTHLPLT